MGIETDQPRIPEGIMEMQAFKERFDPLLGDFLSRKITASGKIINDPQVLDYIDHAANITTESGKRTRPYMAYLMYSALGGKNIEGALRALVSLELFHAFSLIHDDISDEGSTRHGLETVHLHIARKMKERNPELDDLRLGKSQAIVVGDLIYNWSQEALDSNVDFPEEILNKIRNNFKMMANEVALGQMLDIDLPTREVVSLSLIDEKIRLKTASYTFIGPMLIGTSLAGKDTEEIKKFCEELGLRLGIAFQTQDDLLDIISSEEVLGKTISSDTAQRQHTYFTQYLQENGTDDQKTRFAQLSRLRSTPEVRREIQRIFTESGAIDFGQQLISGNIERAKDLIVRAPLGMEGKNSFMKLVEDMAVRTH